VDFRVEAVLLLVMGKFEAIQPTISPRSFAAMALLYTFSATFARMRPASLLAGSILGVFLAP